MIGEAEAEEEFDGFVGFGGFVFVFGFRFAFCFRFFAWRLRFCQVAVGAAFKPLSSFVEAKRLFPGLVCGGRVGLFLRPCQSRIACKCGA